MEVDEGAGAVAVENLADALHGRPVEGHVVEVEAVDADVPREPVEALDVIVVPARHAAVDDGRVLQLGHEPGGDIVGAEVLLEPREAATGAGREDLVAEAAEGEEFGGAVGELADRVVDLDLESTAVSVLDVGFHGRGPEKRVVDVGVDFGGVVDVDDVGARGGDFVQGLALGEVGGRVEGFEGGEEEREIEMERLAGVEGARAGAGGEEDGGRRGG